MRISKRLRSPGGLAVVAGLGAAAALLLAPQPGRQGRRQVRQLAQRAWYSPANELENSRDALARAKDAAGSAAPGLSRNLGPASKAA